MKALVFGIIGVMAFSFAQASTGFSNGNNIDITYYSGWVRVVNCSGDVIGNKSHFCSAADYNPGAFDRFVTDNRVKADRVSLSAVHEDGSTRSKRKKYDSNKGISDKFNLLVSTLFQRPLLEEGVNRVSYMLTNKRSEVASGEFEANVQVTGDLRCPDLTISGWGSTCDNASAACNEYFNRVNGCQ